MRLLNLIWDRKDYLIYRYNIERQGSGTDYPQIKVYNRMNEIPEEYKPYLFHGVFSIYMKMRLEGSDTKILCYIDNNTLIGYGWLQDSKYFKKKFGWVSNGATMFGPYRTIPEYRGNGIYGKLLSQSIAINKSKPAIIVTVPENKSSQKGIEKAGFELVGNFNLTLILQTILLKKT